MAATAAKGPPMLEKALIRGLRAIKLAARTAAAPPPK
eukprot:CAMPEP_0177394160 /NCGR_PEP_ID=MMETSP0368-20130122/55377_1 /TAXON_ID=447022 ORGANISM="Scrippsiella hangoei-like, Strain SHHI-4" /NCGR_SAMPLE_ID=MMETSP0368 /ASSEMBLY_ACC=CAM_ASM_000363 /LENGTH=36 /DNA_ID= /DNA_START= /DNA_END= /DNA_ORIENTATION=